MPLVPSQQQAVNKIVEFIKTGEKRIVLKGSAGTGKTFLTNELIKILKTECYKWGAVYVTAPTHKALAVLKTKITHRPYIEFNTIHSALQMRRTVDKHGTVTFAPPPISKNKNFAPFKNASFVIIDESSMIGKEFLGFDTILHNGSVEHTKGYLENFPNIPFIFIGDDKQLNPVKEIDSPVFTKEYPTVELTEIIRQGEGNPIITLSRDLSLIHSNVPQIVDAVRIIKTPKKSTIVVTDTNVIQQEIPFELDDNIENQDVDDYSNLEDEVEYDEISEPVSNGFIYSTDRGLIIQRLAEVNGTDELKYLAWTNEEVDSMNQAVRKFLYGAHPQRIELGETILFNAPYSDYYTNQELKVETLNVMEKTFIVPTEHTRFDSSSGSMVVVDDFVRENGKITMNTDGSPKKSYDSVNLLVYIINDSVVVLHEKSDFEFTKLKTKILYKCRSMEIPWLAKYFFEEQVANVTYNHAITIHKSQGSTYRKSIINVKNAMINRNIAERNRLLYTAITRSSELTILYNVW